MPYSRSVLRGQSDNGVVPLPPVTAASATASVAAESVAVDGVGGWRRRPCRVPILLYHRVTPRPSGQPHSLAASRFRAHLALLRALRFRSVLPAALADGVRRRVPLPARMVAITLDDGYLDTLTVALPLLQEFGFSATCYLVADRVGRTSDWTDPTPLMGWGEVREWLAAGMAVGSHTLSHRDLTRLAPVALRAEVADSKARIEDRLGIAVGSFAYPFNRCGQRELEAVARAGYTAGCAGPELSDSLFALARLTVRDSLTWLSFLLVPAYPELRHLYLAATGRDQVRRRATALETFPGEQPDR